MSHANSENMSMFRHEALFSDFGTKNSKNEHLSYNSADSATSVAERSRLLRLETALTLRKGVNRPFAAETRRKGYLV